MDEFSEFEEKKERMRFLLNFVFESDVVDDTPRNRRILDIAIFIIRYAIKFMQTKDVNI